MSVNQIGVFHWRLKSIHPLHSRLGGYGAGLETRAHRLKLRPGSVERVREWAAEITRRRDEALATLRDETVVLECFFLERAGDGDHLIAVMTAESFERSRAAVERSLHEIDAYHQQFKRDTWESGGRLELLVELNRLGERG